MEKMIRFSEREIGGTKAKVNPVPVCSLLVQNVVIACSNAGM